MGCFPILIASIGGIVYLLISGNASLGLQGLEVDFYDCQIPRSYPVEGRPDDDLAAALAGGGPSALDWYAKTDRFPDEERFEECMLPTYADDLTGHAEGRRFYFEDLWFMERVNVFADERAAREFFHGVDDLAEATAASITLETTNHEFRSNQPPQEEIHFQHIGDDAKAFRLRYHMRESNSGAVHSVFRDLVYVRLGRVVVLLTLQGYDSSPLPGFLWSLSEAAVARAESEGIYSSADY